MLKAEQEKDTDEGEANALQSTPPPVQGRAVRIRV